MADTQPMLATDEAGAAATSSVAIAGTPLQCLLVSYDAQRRECLDESVRSVGWHSIVCDDAPTAAMHAAHTVIRLAILDLEGFADRGRLPCQQLAERLARQKELLLILCGSEGNATEEIWARQLGVWLYLAGASLGVDFTTICGEAFEAAQRIVTPTAGGFSQGTSLRTR